MATIINNTRPTTTTDDSDALGSILVGIIAVILVILFFVYALPALRSSTSPRTTAPSTINVDLNPTTPASNPAQ